MLQNRLFRSSLRRAAFDNALSTLGLAVDHEIYFIDLVFYFFSRPDAIKHEIAFIHYQSIGPPARTLAAFRTVERISPLREALSAIPS